MPAAKMLIVVVDMPRGPMVITDSDDRPRVFATPAEARAVLASHQILRAFSAELFEIGRGEPL